MSYDPKLKECLTKIEALCKQYECGAYVSLVSRTHGEFRYVLPEWAAMKEEIDDEGRVCGVRLTCKKEEREKAEFTAHFLHSSRDIAALAFKFFDHFIEATQKKWNTEHTSFADYRPHRKDEN